MRNLIPVALGLCFSTSALALDAGLTLEMGRQVLPSESLRPLFSQNASATPAVTLSSDLSNKVTVQLGWQYSSFGSSLDVGTDRSVSLFLSEHRVMPGVHLDAGHERFGPYVEVSGVVGRASLWADDDSTRRTNPGQVKSNALFFGVQPVAGLELAMPFGPPRESRALVFHAEAGWSFETDPTFDNVGQLEHGARVFRGGVTLKI